MTVEEESVSETLSYDELIKIVENNDVEGLKAAFEMDGFDVNMTMGLQKTALHCAVIHDKIAILELLTSHPKINLNAKDYLSKTPLIYAAEFGRLHAIETLLKKGADASCADQECYYALWFAAKTQKRECIETLLRAKNCFPGTYHLLKCTISPVFVEVVKKLIVETSDSYYIEKFGYDLLLNGSVKGSLDTVKFIVEKQVFRPIDLTRSLFAALKGSFLEVADFLIQKGADLTINEDYTGKSTYEYAAEFDNSETFLEKYVPEGAIFIELFKLLVQFSRCKILKSYAAICIEKYPNGLSIVKDVISFAIEKEKEGPLESLLCHITDNDFISQLTTKTVTLKKSKVFVPLYTRLVEMKTKKISIRKLRRSLFVSAIKAKNNFVCDYLLEQGLDPKGLEDGQSYLIMACELGNTELVESLIKHGANVNRLNSNRESALNYAVANNNLKNVLILLKYGADPFVKDRQGDTPLLISANKGHAEVFFELFKLNQNIHQRSKDRFTLIMAACNSGNLEIVKALTEAGACLTKVSKQKENCLHFATENQNTREIMAYLREKLGKSDFIAMLSAANVYGHTPIDFIVKHKSKKDISELLAAIPDLADHIDVPIYMRIQENSADYEMCLICRDEFVQDDCAIVLPCKHVYHEDCYGEWSKAKEICPYCQRSTNPFKKVKTSE